MEAGFEKVYQLVEKARLADPIDTAALDEIRDKYGCDLYKQALDAVLAKLEDYEFVVEKYVVGSSHSEMRLLEQDDLRFILECDGRKAVLEFDPQWSEYVYTVNGKGPFSHSSYEFIAGDVMEVLEMESKSLASKLVAFYRDYDFYDYSDNIEIGQTDEDVIAALAEELTDSKTAAAILESLLEFKAEGPVEEEEDAFLLEELIQEMKDVVSGEGKSLGDILNEDKLSFDDLGLCIGLKDGWTGHSNNFYRHLLRQTDAVPLRSDVGDLLEDARRRSMEHKTDKMTIDILQVKEGAEYQRYRGAPMRWLSLANDPIKPENYDHVYQYFSEDLVDLGSEEDIGEFLSMVYAKFNLRQPEDFAGRRIEVSDVIILEQNNDRKAFYFDTTGFRELAPEFLKEFGARKDSFDGLEKE